MPFNMGITKFLTKVQRPQCQSIATTHVIPTFYPAGSQNEY